MRVLEVDTTLMMEGVEVSQMEEGSRKGLACWSRQCVATCHALWFKIVLVEEEVDSH